MHSNFLDSSTLALPVFVGNNINSGFSKVKNASVIFVYRHTTKGVVDKNKYGFVYINMGFRNIFIKDDAYLLLLDRRGIRLASSADSSAYIIINLV